MDESCPTCPRRWLRVARRQGRVAGSANVLSRRDEGLVASFPRFFPASSPQQKFRETGVTAESLAAALEAAGIHLERQETIPGPIPVKYVHGTAPEVLGRARVARGLARRLPTRYFRCRCYGQAADGAGRARLLPCCVRSLPYFWSSWCLRAQRSLAGPRALPARRSKTQRLPKLETTAVARRALNRRAGRVTTPTARAPTSVHPAADWPAVWSPHCQSLRPRSWRPSHVVAEYSSGSPSRRVV